VFSVDARRQQVIDCNQPVKKLPPNKVSMTVPASIENGNGMKPQVPKITVSFDAMPALESEDMMAGVPQVANPQVKGRRPSVNAKLVVTGKKVWSCGKCATCTAEDCGKCIYCLDRPKFGGPFIKKQRCIKRRCLMKIKNKQTLLRA
jgi:hypothetical protein